MPDLFEKLNVLVKSNLRSALSLDLRKPAILSGSSRSLEKDVATLRERINQALEDEDRLQRDIQALRDEAAEWDRKADSAIASGDEANARYAVQQMQLKQQQATLLEADLEQHRLSAAELIRQVNELEAVAAEAAAQAAAESTADTVAPAASEASAATEAPSAAASQEEATQPSASDDDLAQRRARLSQ